MFSCDALMVPSRSTMFCKRTLFSKHNLLLVMASFAFIGYLWHDKTSGKLSENTACNRPSDVDKKLLGTTGNSVEIEPFPHFDPGANVDKNKNLYRAYYWWNLWEKDTACKHYDVHFLNPGAYPKPGALVSFPGSGNSWLRSLLMGATGIYVSSIYGNEATFFALKDERKKIFPVDNGNSMLLKTHDFSLLNVFDETLLKNQSKELQQFNQKGLLIIRNPFKSLISFRNFESGGMTGIAPESDFEGEGWDGFVGTCIVTWEWLARVWIQGLKQGGIIYYERLVHDTRHELRRIIKMMGLSVNEGRFECVMRHTADNVFKRTNKTKVRDPYTISQKILIRKAIDNVQLALKERNLDPLPVHLYELYDSLPKDTV